MHVMESCQEELPGLGPLLDKEEVHNKIASPAYASGTPSSRIENMIVTRLWGYLCLIEPIICTTRSIGINQLGAAEQYM